jgi:putative spermidine/putrescine transport system ATP-binding protein
VHALDGLDLELAPGELVALLGPSGCGKTTALRVLAGLEDLDSGRVVVAGTDITTLPASRRDMGMVFQAYSLFPHLTALENVAFGLRMRRVDGAERRRRAGEALEQVGLGALTGRYAQELSGGQQQRVALARALAIRPRVLLLDEPLSALDARVRAQLREEIRRIQMEVGTTTLFVPHDQEEALAIADRVGVMRSGRLEQIAGPEDVYARPATRFVAEFVGITSRLPGVSRGDDAEVGGGRVPLLPGSPARGPVDVLVRPEAIEVYPASRGGAQHAAAAGAPGAGEEGAPGTVRAVIFLGASARVTVSVDSGTELHAQVPAERVAQLAPGTPVRYTLSPTPALAVAAEPVP